MADNKQSDAEGRGKRRATLLLTRPRDQSERFAAEVRTRNPELRIVVAPLLEIVPVGDPPDLATVDGVIFSSANGVARAGPGRGVPAFCVGEGTTAAARAAGFDAVFGGRTADDLVIALSAARPAGRLVHLRGMHQRGDIAARLAQAGLSVTESVVYEQRAAAPGLHFAEALAARPLLVPLFSPRSAELFHKAARPVLGKSLPDRVDVITLSAAVADRLPESWRDGTHIAASPDRSGMLDGIAGRVYP